MVYWFSVFSFHFLSTALHLLEYVSKVEIDRQSISSSHHGYRAIIIVVKGGKMIKFQWLEYSLYVDIPSSHVERYLSRSIDRRFNFSRWECNKLSTWMSNASLFEVNHSCDEQSIIRIRYIDSTYFLIPALSIVSYSSSDILIFVSDSSYLCEK